MKTILLLAGFTIVTNCDSSSSEVQVMPAKPKKYDPSLNKSIFNISSEHQTERTPLQSDIVVAKSQAEEYVEDIENNSRLKRQVVKGDGTQDYRWSDGVFYTFNTNDSMVQKVFKMGIKVWADATCIDFAENGSAKDKVIVVKERSNWSKIGRLGGDQLLSLCGILSEGAAVHEIGHVLGLFHTMSRHDRDDYIKLARQNMAPRAMADFEKVDLSIADVYGLTYDYGSIMHYGELSASINQRPAIIAKDQRYQKTMGADLISFSDLFMINEHYGCNARCNTTTSAKCANEGFPHPRNCSICICPGGYGGALCDQRPPGCGRDLIAARQKQKVEYKLGVGHDLRDHFEFCNYMITAHNGKKIEVDVQLYSLIFDNAGCTRGGVEIKAQKDQKLTGYRFCSMKGTDGPIVSNSNRLPLILYNRLGMMHVTFTYRYVN